MSHRCLLCAQVKHLQETMSTDAATIQRLQAQLSDAQAVIDSFEEQAANQVWCTDVLLRPRPAAEMPCRTHGCLQQVFTLIPDRASCFCPVIPNSSLISLRSCRWRM